MSGLTVAALWALQQGGQGSPRLGAGQELNLGQIWESGGFMMWPLGAALGIGLLIILWKFIDMQIKSSRTRSFLDEVDELIVDERLGEALAMCEESKSPAASVLQAGLQRRDEGTERVTQAIENAGAIQMVSLEKGLVWLATIANVAPLMGFLGTVIGMIQAFQAIEIAGEVQATLVAGGIKVALITTATGLTIAIPMNIMHNYFVSQVDQLVIDMEESTQKMIDVVHEG